MHITPKVFLRLVFSQTAHAWIRKNICNTRTRTHSPTRSLSLILSLSATAMYVHKHTHTHITHTHTHFDRLLQQTLTPRHTGTDTPNMIRGLLRDIWLSVIHVEPKALRGKSLCSRPSDTRSLITLPPPFQEGNSK